MFRAVCASDHHTLEVVRQLGSGAIFNIQFTADLLGNLPVNFFVERLRFDRIIAMSLWPHFFAHPQGPTLVSNLAGHVGSGVTGHRQPRQCRGAQGPKVTRNMYRLCTGISQNHRYTDTFCYAVDCRLELALEVQRWARARSECLPGCPKIIVTPLLVGRTTAVVASFCPSVSLVCTL